MPFLPSASSPSPSSQPEQRPGPAWSFPSLFSVFLAPKPWAGRGLLCLAFWARAGSAPSSAAWAPGARTAVVMETQRPARRGRPVLCPRRNEPVRGRFLYFVIRGAAGVQRVYKCARERRALGLIPGGARVSPLGSRSPRRLKRSHLPLSFCPAWWF